MAEAAPEVSEFVVLVRKKQKFLLSFILIFLIKLIKVFF